MPFSLLSYLFLDLYIRTKFSSRNHTFFSSFGCLICNFSQQFLCKKQCLIPNPYPIPNSNFFRIRIWPKLADSCGYGSSTLCFVKITVLREKTPTNFVKKHNSTYVQLQYNKNNKQNFSHVASVYSNHRQI
jgi:hypothetical protein